MDFPTQAANLHDTRLVGSGYDHLQTLCDETFAFIQTKAALLGLPLMAGLSFPFDQCPDEAVELRFQCTVADVLVMLMNMEAPAVKQEGQ